jgi:hypothetical protein
MIRAFAVALTLAVPAAAETARVYSGEHGDYTRLVIELPAAADWTLGRIPSGYAFAVTVQDQPDYDMSAVWQRIARTRLASLGIEPGSGALTLDLACDCHVFPFEYRPGVVVLDIKPGPPPQGSAFETAFQASATADDRTLKASESGAAGSYDWLADRSGTMPKRTDVSLPLPLPTGGISLEPLRDAMLQDIAKGAADGLVDMRLPSSNQAGSQGDLVALPWSNIRFGEQPGIMITDPDMFTEDINPAGACAEADLLDLAAWGQDRAPADLLSEARSGLYGEFDAPEPTAVLRSVQLHLYLGFGAEARQHAAMIPSESDLAGLDLYRSMARIIDEESDPVTPFASMLDCDGPAALWAALARDRLPFGPGVNRNAILRGFLALPPHLRSHLGASLAERFLALDDADAARVIRDAMQRSPQTEPAEIALLDAASDLQIGETDAALDHAREAVALDGNGAEALVTLVETHLRKLEPISPDVAEALLALQVETRGTEVAPDVARAIVLAHALSGQTEAAFAAVQTVPDSLSDLWSIVQNRATDDDFLRHAVLSEGVSPPVLVPELDLAIARRLVALGFPDAALGWIKIGRPTDPLELRLVAAEAELDRGNAQVAADLLSGAVTKEAVELRRRALQQLGISSEAEATLAGAEQAQQTEPQAGLPDSFPRSNTIDPDIWKTAERLAQPLPPDAATGLLGRGSATLDASVEARSAIEALLNSVPDPTANADR